VELLPTDDFADVIDALPAGASGPTLTFWYVIRMADGTFARAEATITFEGVNDEATIHGDLVATTDEDTPVSGTASVSDVDTGEAKFGDVAADDLETVYGTFTFDSETGDWTFTPNDYADTLNAGDKQQVKLTVTSFDGTATADIVVTIEGTNDPAAITGNTTGTVKEDRAAVATGVLTATDVDNLDGFQAVTDQLGANGYGRFSIDEDGNWTYALDNDAVQGFVTGQSTSDSFTFLSVDGTAETVTVTIEGTDEPVTVVLQYTPAKPDEVVPGEMLNETYSVLPPATSPTSGPNNVIPLWNDWIANLNQWRASFAPEQDSNTATVTVAVGSRSYTYDATFSYTSEDVTIPGDPAELIILDGDAFLFWNADSALTFTGAPQAEIENLATIGLAEIGGDAEVADTVLLFTDGSTLTLFDANFENFTQLFASTQVSVL